MTIDRIKVRSSVRSYEVLCGDGALGGARREIARLGLSTGVYLLSSPRVWKHWGKKCHAFFSGLGAARVILFDDREAAKNLRTMETICRKLVHAGADRRAVLVAIGGGVVGDVAGFAAASYLRGVMLVHVPTTLVAQVDSAIGGKTGVNLPEGKNLVGAFYPPRLVIVDPRMLATLPDWEYRSGLYEVIKYGVIGDRALFAYLEKHLDKLLFRDGTALRWVIAHCVRAKARIVSRDEREAGLREVLNFGHTFAHALETVTRYRKFLHGEAVGWGMIAAAALSEDLRLLAPSDVARIARLVLQIGTVPQAPRFAPAQWIAAMRADKKNRRGRMRFVLARGIGRVSRGVEVPETKIAGVLERITEDPLLNWSASFARAARGSA